MTNNSLLKYSLATLLLFPLHSFEQTIATEQAKSATTFTRQLNESVYSSLNFADSTDFQDARKGFIATLDSGIIRNAAGNIIVNENDYNFIQGKAPATVNPALWRQAKVNDINGLFKITDGVYQVRGFDASNIVFIQTKSGYIVIDVLTNASTAKAAFDIVKKYVGDKPVLAVITTHSHADHFGGIEGIANAADIASGKIKYITPTGFYEEAVSENVLLGNVMRRRADYQFGGELQPSVTGQIDVGLGKSFLGGGKSTLLQSTVQIDSTNQTITIDGTQLIFQLTPNSEAPAELTLYLPSKKIFFGAELVSHTLHNVLTPRGAKDRDAKSWAHYIDQAIDLFGDNTEIVVPAHTWPVYGHDRSITFLEKQRDLYKYIHDQTVHLANQGLNKEEIAETIKLPAELSKEWYDQDFYGTVKHNSKAVYQYYLGWWDGNPADYNPLPQTESAKKYVEWMGGEDAVLKRAKESYAKGEYRWVAQVLKNVVFANPANQAAKNLQADAFEQLAYQSESGIWRDLYLSGAKELREGVAPSKGNLPGASYKFFSGLTPQAIFDFLSITVDGTKAAGKDISLRFIFPDQHTNILVYLKNGVLHQTTAKPNVDADFTLTISKEKFAQLLSDKDKARDILFSDGVSFTGDPFKFKELAETFEPFNPNWNIVTP
jgi:alkyl sulfatase BDS1-like metallo-beta-lactamase superfamily hydrolase